MVAFMVQRKDALDIYNFDNIRKIRTDFSNSEIIIYFVDGSSETVSFETPENYNKAALELNKMIFKIQNEFVI